MTDTAPQHERPAMARQPVKPGAYGRVWIGGTGMQPGTVRRIVYIPLPGYGMTADELREAAHLFNQLAETMEQ